MKLCAAQTRPVVGDFHCNIEQHERMVRAAAALDADFVVFPELSLTGYEPKLAQELATTVSDARLDPFQDLSDSLGITIGVGLPIRGTTGILIGTVYFQAGHPRTPYFKQRLHADERPFFIEGNQDVLLETKGHRVAPAICYESLQSEHSEAASLKGAQVYCASVAKSATGVAKGLLHYPATAKKYSMTVLMSNCLGPNDDFGASGRSSIWGPDGILAGQLDGQNEDLLLYDTETAVAMARGLDGSAKMIRRARPGDEQGIHEAHMRSIREVCSKDHGEDEIRGWGNRQLGDRWTSAIRDGHVWVIDEGDVIRGMAYIRVLGHEAHIFGLYLTPEVLRCGFGSSLVELMLERARSAGVSTVTLDSTLTAHDFYKRLGFSDSGPMKWTEIGGSRVRGYPMALQIRPHQV